MKTISSILFIFFCLSLSNNLLSQHKTQYFDRNWNLLSKNKDRKKAYYVRNVEQTRNKLYLVNNYYVSDKKILASSKTYRDVGLSVPEGKHDAFYRNGKTKSSGAYTLGRKQGQWIFYWTNGNIRQIGNFSNGERDGIWKRFRRNAKLWAEDNYVNGVTHGLHTEYFENGKPRVIANYNMNKLDGELISYYSNDNIARKELYENDELLEKQCYTQDGRDTFYFPYLVMPMYPGCEDQQEWILMKNCADKLMYSKIQEDLEYPLQSRLAGREGTVILQFNVTEEGELKDPMFIEDVSEEIGAECLRLIHRFPKWLPGTKDGIPALTQFELPIVFRLGQ